VEEGEKGEEEYDIKTGGGGWREEERRTRSSVI